MKKNCIFRSQNLKFVPSKIFKLFYISGGLEGRPEHFGGDVAGEEYSPPLIYSMYALLSHISQKCNEIESSCFKLITHARSSANLQ